MAFVILEKCFLRFGVDKNGREKLQNIQNPSNKITIKIKTTSSEI
jgi:hypothetical protein